jgi:hypothetical protein
MTDDAKENDGLLEDMAKVAREVMSDYRIHAMQLYIRQHPQPQAEQYLFAAEALRVAADAEPNTSGQTEIEDMNEFQRLYCFAGAVHEIFAPWLNKYARSLEKEGKFVEALRLEQLRIQNLCFPSLDIGDMPQDVHAGYESSLARNILRLVPLAAPQMKEPEIHRILRGLMGVYMARSEEWHAETLLLMRRYVGDKAADKIESDISRARPKRTLG